MASAALAALESNFPLLPRVHALASRVGDYLRDIGYELSLPVSTNIIILDLRKMKISGQAFVNYCKQRGVRVLPMGRLVFHHQTSEDGISRLQSALFDLITDSKRSQLLN
jgi:threonine aldolase